MNLVAGVILAERGLSFRDSIPVNAEVLNARAKTLEVTQESDIKVMKVEAPSTGDGENTERKKKKHTR